MPWPKGRLHTEDEKRKISEGNKGRCHTDATKRFLRIANTGKHLSEETKRKLSMALKGKKRSPFSEETRKRMSLAKMGHKCSEETRRKISEANRGKAPSFKGRHHTEESKQKMSNSSMGQRSMMKGKKTGVPSPLRGRKCSIEHRLKNSLARKGIKLSREHRQAISTSHKRLWQDPGYAKIASKAMGNMQTRLEKILDSLLQAHFPGEWKYVGDGQVWLSGRNPDFININGQKKIIELFGTYWHKTMGDVEYIRTEDGRISHFKQFGFETLVIWDRELEDHHATIKRIGEFTHG